MANPIKVIIKGTDADGTDAPTVDDLLGQVRDFVEILLGVERALEPDGNQIVWRVTDITRNSPISVELTPFPTDHAAFVGYRASRVELATSEGLAALQGGELRPAYFTDDVLPKARKMHERVTNGLAETKIRFASLPKVAPTVIGGESARRVVTTAAEAQQATATHQWRELGSLEGYFARAELDGFGRPVLWFRSRMDNAVIKAVANGEAIRQLEHTQLGEVWSGARIRVYGIVHYKGDGAVDHLDADYIEQVNTIGLPGLDDIIDENFAGGLTTEEFLREQRGE